MQNYLLDTSALITLKENEPGTTQVESILERGKKGSAIVFASFMSFMEVYYCVFRALGKGAALQTYLELKTLPLHRVDATESLLLLAGEIKATYPMSLADSWIAATAIEKQAVLVHKDPEFEPLKDRIVLETLPYKN